MTALVGSVIMPVFNAMPWLPIAVRDILKQDLGGARQVELICSDDGSSDGGYEFMCEVAEGLSTRGQKISLRQSSPTVHLLAFGDWRARLPCDRQCRGIDSTCPRNGILTIARPSDVPAQPPKRIK